MEFFSYVYIEQILVHDDNKLQIGL